MKARGDYINGRFVKRRRATGELVSAEPAAPDRTIGTFPTFAEAPGEALAAARAALPQWSGADQASRSAALRRLQAQLRNRGEDLASLLCRETGRPLWETRSEVRMMHAELDGLLRGVLGERQPPAAQPPVGTEVTERPIGVVVVISPCPQPLLLLHADAAAAVAVGCTVVCKPSPRAPAAAQLYAELVDEADLPRGVLNLVQGGDDVGEALVNSEGYDGLLFCGSERNAAMLQRSLCNPGAPRLRTVTTGMSAALVLDDANLDQAAYQIAIGALITAGQRCTSTKRVIVDRRVAQPLIDRLAQLIARLTIGPVARPDVFMGPLIDETARKRHLEAVARLEAADAETLVRGGPMPAPDEQAGNWGAFARPSLLQLEPAGLAEACDKEIGGPLLLLCRADGLDQALELEARAPYALSTAVFTRSLQRFGEAFARCRGGLCLQNAPTTRWPGRLPLQPGRRSGNGWPWGSHTRRVCTALSVSARDDSAFDPTILPPGMPPVGL